MQLHGRHSMLHSVPFCCHGSVINLNKSVTALTHGPKQCQLLAKQLLNSWHPSSTAVRPLTSLTELAATH